MPEFWAKLSIWPELHELCLSKQLSPDLGQLLLAAMCNTRIFFRKGQPSFLCAHRLWHPWAALRGLFVEGLAWAVAALCLGVTHCSKRLGSQGSRRKKPWNYSGSRRKWEKIFSLFWSYFQSFNFVILLLKFSNYLSHPLSLDITVYFSSSFLMTDIEVTSPFFFSRMSCLCHRVSTVSTALLWDPTPQGKMRNRKISNHWRDCLDKGSLTRNPFFFFFSPNPQNYLTLRFT